MSTILQQSPIVILLIRKGIVVVVKNTTAIQVAVMLLQTRQLYLRRTHEAVNHEAVYAQTPHLSTRHHYIRALHCFIRRDLNYVFYFPLALFHSCVSKLKVLINIFHGKRYFFKSLKTYCISDEKLTESKKLRKFN